MPYLYHGVPTDLRGTTLYPLNQLRAIHPDLFEREIAKYQDHRRRQLLPETRLPMPDCLWNDVIHTAPIQPHRLYRAWIERGAKVDPNRQFFRIPKERVAIHPAGWMVGRDVTPVDWATYIELTQVPEVTLIWYDKLVTQGKHGGDFVSIPHVLIKGPIDITGLEPIRWQTSID